jgi:hypothetical protein
MPKIRRNLSTSDVFSHFAMPTLTGEHGSLGTVPLFTNPSKKRQGLVLWPIETLFTINLFASDLSGAPPQEGASAINQGNHEIYRSKPSEL